MRRIRRITLLALALAALPLITATTLSAMQGAVRALYAVPNTAFIERLLMKR
jgi:hypothetical protein